MKPKKMPLLLTFLLLTGLLWGLTGAVQAQPAEAGIFEDLKVQPGVSFEVPVAVCAVEDLYAVDIELHFDPAILQAVDADPQTEGVQAGLGPFLKAGLLLYNEIDNQNGVVRFAMTQVNPAEPISGDGVLLVLYYVAQAAGETKLAISFLEAATRYGEEIILKPVEGRVTVAASAPTFNATPLPVQDPGLAILVPTLDPTQMAMAAQTQAAMPTLTERPISTATAVFTATLETPAEVAEVYPALTESRAEPLTAYPGEAATEEAVQKSRTIVDYWWVVLIVVLAAGGLGSYLFLSKKRTSEGQDEREDG